MTSELVRPSFSAWCRNASLRSGSRRTDSTDAAALPIRRAPASAAQRLVDVVTGFGLASELIRQAVRESIGASSGGVLIS
jgi:hypothetical protein